MISFLADLLSCRVQDDAEEDMSGQAIVGQAVPGMLASGDGNDSTDSQVVLGVANVHVDAVAKIHIIMSWITCVYARDA